MNDNLLTMSALVFPSQCLLFFVVCVFSVHNHEEALMDRVPSVQLDESSQLQYLVVDY